MSKARCDIEVHLMDRSEVASGLGDAQTGSSLWGLLFTSANGCDHQQGQVRAATPSLGRNTPQEQTLNRSNRTWSLSNESLYLNH